MGESNAFAPLENGGRMPRPTLSLFLQVMRVQFRESRKGFSNSWLDSYSSKISPSSASAGLTGETVHNPALHINVYWAASMQ